MPTRVLIPTPLRVYAGKQDVIEVEGDTVGELLANMTAEYTELRKHLYNEDGRLRAFVAIFLNDDDIRFLEKEATPVKEGDTVSIIPTVAGGGGQ
ncbi:MAG: MoaD/ThiS family protein [Acidobacteria bacterium]|nr:MoaD/ThiS family protein [Acidobacteriota bacterium]MYI75287.1 MoaD/ThiS family protein [Acidobacteriota bacterium]